MTDLTAGDPAEAGEDALCAAAGLGDREAFEVLIHRYGPPLYRYGRRMLADEADVADVVQETFVAAWRQLPSFRGASSLQTWLFSICARKVVDTYRIRRAVPLDDRLLEALPAADSGDPFVVASNREFLAALEQALAELPIRQRAAWMMREIESMTFPEIGQVLGLSPDAVRGHYHRATCTLGIRLRRWR
ncbi:RNA polymerase sigma factor [Rhodococcus opacus]|uniref:RNA polymerase subunit sigma-70 n=1 Tax=Rhodococcus opacus TaxID=37919 RepID=A0A2S8IIE9_RHOOP|nr:sigma-70 family RNA polymerase sigma factor [Rhodococcus opacus]PQP14485.1 RNA polymerase subunit sigma-70 [Rhodococcus opacus]